jgi:SAM-dependent methyltransferase
VSYRKEGIIMAQQCNLPTLPLLDAKNGWIHRKKILSDFVQSYFKEHGTIKILEAGCGRGWSIELGSLNYTITGIDIDARQLNARKNNVDDLDNAIVGDLRTIKMVGAQFDMIYCQDVIEHIQGAEGVLDNFFEWLRSDGLLVLHFPDRDSCAGYITRIMPHWVHILYYKYFMEHRLAGSPGFGPFRTFFDCIVSRRGIHNYCNQNGHRVLLEFGRAPDFRRLGKLSRPIRTLLRLIQCVSFGRLTASHGGLVYAISKV